MSNSHVVVGMFRSYAMPEMTKGRNSVCVFRLLSAGAVHNIYRSNSFDGARTDQNYRERDRLHQSTDVGLPFRPFKQ